jgi:hypothetical protein
MPEREISLAESRLQRLEQNTRAVQEPDSISAQVLKCGFAGMKFSLFAVM